MVSQIDRIMFGKLFGLNAKSAHAISLKSKVLRVRIWELTLKDAKSDQVRKCALHPLEINDAADEQSDNNSGAYGDYTEIGARLAEKGPAKSFDHPRQRVKAIEQPPFFWNQTDRIRNR